MTSSSSIPAGTIIMTSLVQQSQMSIVFLVLVLILQLKGYEGGVLLSGPERTLSCPGSSVQYSCDVSPAVNSITWSLQCPNMRATTYSVGRQQSNYNSIYNCSTAGVSLSTSIVFHSDGSVAAQSNLSISVLVTSYSVNTFRSLRIDCEDSGNFKYMDAKGPPSPPLNLLHSFGSLCLSNNTHVPTTISWSPPQPSEGSYPVEGYGLTITRLSDPAHVETSVWAESGTNSVTVPLLHSQTYRLNLFAISCGGVLRSRNDSISILPPQSTLSCVTSSEADRGISVTAGNNGSVTDGDGRLFTIVVSAVTVGLFLSMCLTFSLVLYLIHTCRQWVDVTRKAKSMSDPSMKKRKVSPPTTAAPLIYNTGLPPGSVVMGRKPAKQAAKEDFQLDRNIAYETVMTPKGPWHK